MKDKVEIKVTYNKQLSDITKIRRETLILENEYISLNGLIKELDKMYGCEFSEKLINKKSKIYSIIIFINGKRAYPESLIRNGDTVIFMQPILGG